MLEMEEDGLLQDVQYRVPPKAIRAEILFRVV